MPVIPMYGDSYWGYSSVQSHRTHSSFFAPDFAVDPSGTNKNVVNPSVVATKINKCVLIASPEERDEAKAIGR